MARQIRKKSGTGIYHVMLRGINRWGWSPTTVKTNWRFIWSNSEVDKMITRTDPMITQEREKEVNHVE